MKITDKLSKYRSKEYCNLDMFKSEPLRHMTKTWMSKDEREFLICKMETTHLWNVYRMLMRIIEDVNNYDISFGSLSDIDNLEMMTERKLAEARADVALNALQYIGHELYKREVKVPILPKKNFKKKINRADNLNKGFVDIKEIGLDWNNGEFYKE